MVLLSPPLSAPTTSSLFPVFALKYLAVSFHLLQAFIFVLYSSPSHPFTFFDEFGELLNCVFFIELIILGDFNNPFHLFAFGHFSDPLDLYSLTHVNSSLYSRQHFKPYNLQLRSLPNTLSITSLSNSFASHPTSSFFICHHRLASINMKQSHIDLATLLPEHSDLTLLHTSHHFYHDTSPRTIT